MANEAETPTNDTALFWRGMTIAIVAWSITAGLLAYGAMTGA